MDVSSRREAGHVVVSVRGEVDLYTSPGLRDALAVAVGQKEAVVIVDLREVTYMDSSGIATLVVAHGAAKKGAGRLVLVGLTDRVREVFKLARLESVFELAPTVEAALASGGVG
jgi:anti-sigma B factor antagonist